MSQSYTEKTALFPWANGWFLVAKFNDKVDVTRKTFIWRQRYTLIENNKDFVGRPSNSNYPHKKRFYWLFYYLNLFENG